MAFQSGVSGIHIRLIQQLRNELTEEDFMNLKLICKGKDFGGFGTGELEKITTLSELFSRLQQKRIFKAGSYSKLKELLRQIGNDALIEKVTEAEGEMICAYTCSGSETSIHAIHKYCNFLLVPPHGGDRPRIMYLHSGSAHSWVQNVGFVRQDAMMPSIVSKSSVTVLGRQLSLHTLGYGIFPAMVHRSASMQPLNALPITLGSGGYQLMQHGGGSALHEIQNMGSVKPHAIEPSVNEACPETPKVYQKCHLTNAATVPSMRWKRTSFKRGVTFVILLSSLLASCSATNTVECPVIQYSGLKETAVVQCDSLQDLPFIYWFNDIEDDATAFIQKVNGEVTGSGYTAGDFNINNEGSLVINNVTIGDDRTFRVRALDRMLVSVTYDIRLIVCVEPPELLPVIPECSGQSMCVLKGESDRVISCIHGKSRPAMEVSWFLRDGREDQPLDATVNQTQSADLVTFTTSAEVAIEKIAIDANMNQFMVLVCKSNQSVPGTKGSQREVLLDFSVDVPFTNEENFDRVYAFERQEDFKIKCQSEIDCANNVVLWMYKSLDSEDFENILYSAYGEVALTVKMIGFNITDDGALVIKEVDRQHEGYYACVSSLANTFVKNLEVIVLPNPPRIVVKGCEPFQPCHLSAQEADTITCTLNGVRPQLDLSIVTYSMNAAITNTAVNSHKEGDLFYTTVEGHVDISKVTCEENHVAVICQARGPAAYGFMSDATIMISVGGDDCAKTSTDLLNLDDDGSGSYLWALLLPCLLLVVIPLLVYMIWYLKVAGGQCSPHHEMNSLKKDVEALKFSNGESGSYLLPIPGGSKGESESEQHQPVAEQIDDRSGS